jgi:hypothetical protein
MHALMHIPAGCNTSRLPNEVPKSQLKEEVSKNYLNNTVQNFLLSKTASSGWQEPEEERHPSEREKVILL